MSDQPLDLSISDGIAGVTLNRPPVNALNTQLVNRLRGCVQELKASGEVRVVILTGSGQYFSAGADLKERKNMDEAAVRGFIRSIRTAFFEWYNLEVPTICALNGGAYGGGLELALMCDIRFMADDAELGLRETRLGIIPGAGGTQRLARIAGEAKALEWILPGNVHPAEKAEQDGIVNRLAPRDQVYNAAVEFACEIRKSAPIAVRQAKRAIREGLELSFEEGLSHETECYTVTIPTRDRREALRAFAEKRPPEWEGR